MSRNEIEDWALANGFIRFGELLAADYGSARVEISFEGRWVKSRILQGVESHQLGRSRYSGIIHVNDAGVLEGLGLSASFLAVVDRTGVVPVWFTDAYREALGIDSNGEEAISAP